MLGSISCYYKKNKAFFIKKRLYILVGGGRWPLATENE